MRRRDDGTVDVCHRLSDKAGTYDKTYAATKSDQSSAPYFWGALGGAMVLCGAVSWPIRRRRATRRRREAAS